MIIMISPLCHPVSSFGINNQIVLGVSTPIRPLKQDSKNKTLTIIGETGALMYYTPSFDLGAVISCLISMQLVYQMITYVSVGT